MNRRTMNKTKKISNKLFHILMAVTLSLVMIPSGAFVNVGKAFADQNEALILPGSEGSEEATEPEAPTSDPEAVPEVEAQAPASAPVVNSNEVIPVSDFAELRSYVQDTTITEIELILMKDLKCVENEAGITCPNNKNVILDFNGHTINRNQTVASDKGYLFLCNGSITLKNGTITGCWNSGNGGAITTTSISSSNISIENCTFINNKSYSNGGAISMESKGSLIVKNSKILNNSIPADSTATSPAGGGVYINNYNDSTRTFDNCIISGNHIDNYGSGGGMFINSRLTTLNNCVVSENYIVSNVAENHSYGAAIACNTDSANTGNLVINGGIISNNYFEDAPNTVNGGVAVFSSKFDSISINGTKVYKNYAYVPFIIFSQGSLSIDKGAEFFGNYSPSFTEGYVIYNEFSEGTSAEVNYINAKIYGNNIPGISETGNAVRNLYGDFSVYDNFKGNGVLNEVAGLYEKGPDSELLNVRLNYCKFNLKGNPVEGNKIGIYASGGTPTITSDDCSDGWETVFKADYAADGYYVAKQPTDNGYKYLISRYESTWDDLKTAFGCGDLTFGQPWENFFSCEGEGSSASPRKITLKADVLCENATSENFLQVPNGKVVELDLNGYKLDRGLSSSIQHGFVIWNLGNLTITDNSDNKTGVITGGYGHEGEQEAGGIVCSNGVLNFKGGHIYKCSNDDYGGGISCFEFSQLNMTGGRISECEAQRGAGIFLDNSSGSTSISGGIIEKCHASQYGGGICACSVGDFFNLYGGTICKNSCEGSDGISGAGIAILEKANISEANGQEINIYGNTCTNYQYGSGIFAAPYDGTIQLISGDVYGNDGSGVFVVYDPDCENDITVINPAKFKIHDNYLGGTFDEATGCYVANDWSQPCNLEINNGKYGSLDGRIRVVHPLTATDNVIGVSVANNLDNDPYVFSAFLMDDAVAKYFKADDTSEHVYYDEGYLKIAKFGPWFGLQQALAGNNPGSTYSPYFTIEESTIKLMQDITCTDQSLGALTVPENTAASIDLNGHKIDRGLTEATENGSVIINAGSLAITDNTIDKNGKITGGWTTTNGGGIYSTGNLTLNSGTICNCKAEQNGGGIYLQNGDFSVAQDFVVSENEAGESGGGLCFTGSDPSTVEKTISGKYFNNKGDTCGGISYRHQTSTLILNSVKVTGNIATDDSGSGGVYYGGNGLTLEGENNIIKDNVAGADAHNSNVCIMQNKYVSLDGTLSNSTVGVNVINSSHAEFSFCDAPQAAQLFADNALQGEYLFWEPNQLSIEKYTNAWSDLQTAFTGATPSGETYQYFFTCENVEGSYLKITLISDISCLDQDLGPITLPQNAAMPVVLDLNGHTLDRGLEQNKSAARTNGSVIKNAGSLTIQDNSDNHDGRITGGNCNGEGGGVYCDEDSTFVLKSGIIDSCYSTSDGGGAYIHNATFIMKGGTISNCTANNEYYNEAGGAIYLYTNKNCSIEDGIIEDNYAYGYGGGLAASLTGNANVEISGCTIRNNCQGNNYDSDTGGAGIYVYAYNSSDSILRLEEKNGKHINVYGNYSDNENGSVGGGINIYGEFNAEFISGTVQGNLCEGIYTYGFSGNFLINTNFICKDNFKNGLYNEESHIYEKGDSGISSNIAIDDDLLINVEGSQFVDNKIGVTVDGTPTFDVSIPFTTACSKNYSNVFVSDRADEGLYISQNTSTKCMQVSASTSPWMGLSNLISGSSVSPSLFQKWFTFYGSLESPQGLTVVLRDDILCTSYSYLLMVSVNKKVTIDLNGHTLDYGLGSASTGRSDGSVIYNNCGDLSIVDNSEWHTGRIIGGFSSEDSSYAGGVYSRGSLYSNRTAKLKLENITIENCRAGSYGGGVNIHEHNDVHIKNVTIKNCLAPNGAGIAAYGGTVNLDLDGLKISNCISSNNGGGIYFDTTGNTQSSSLILKNSDISNNTCNYDETGTGPNTGKGGGLYIKGSPNSNIVLQNSIISKNKANDGASGGGLFIYTTSSTFATIDNCIISENTTYRNEGSGVCLMGDGATVEFIDGEICGNYQQDSYSTSAFGGGIYISSKNKAIVNGTDIHHNVALTNGAGIYNTGALDVKGNAKIHDNNCSGVYENGGGIMYYPTNSSSNASLNLISGSVYNNNGGGGICIYNKVNDASVPNVSTGFKIVDNYMSDGTASNMFINFNCFVNILESYSNARNVIGITHAYANEGTVFAKNVNHEYLKDYFVSDERREISYDAEGHQLTLGEPPTSFAAARGQSSIDSGATLGSEANDVLAQQGDSVVAPLRSEANAVEQAEAAAVASPAGVVAAVQNWFAAAVDSASPFAVYIIIGLALASLAGCGFVLYRVRKRD